MNVADAHSGTVEVADGAIAYDIIGHGAPLVLIHSTLADRRMWDRELLSYPRRFRVVRYDLRGCGRSTPAHGPFSNVDDLRELLDELGFDRVDLLGSSAGGIVALDFAFEFPSRVRKLVLVGSGLGLVRPPADPHVESAIQDLKRIFGEQDTEFRAGKLEAVVRSLLTTFGAALVDPDRTHLATLFRTNLEEAVTDRSQSHATGRLTEERLNEIRIPTLALLGTRDHPAPRWAARQVAESIPGCRCVDVLGADHFPNLSRPGDFDSAVLSFLTP